jgi:hypothetical protein
VPEWLEETWSGGEPLEEAEVVNSDVGIGGGHEGEIGVLNLATDLEVALDHAEGRESVERSLFPNWSCRMRVIWWALDWERLSF